MANTQLTLFCAMFVIMMEVSGQLKTTCFFNQRCRCKTSNKTYVEVDCSHAKLRDIPYLPQNVSSVDLSYNNIHKIPEHFKNNDISTEINFSQNRLLSLNKEMFYGLNSVSKIKTNNNIISKATKDVFLNLRTLSFLDVKNNNISWSNHNVIFSSSLLTLNIDYNASHENLPDMAHLETLDIFGSSGQCDIHTVKPDKFRSVPKIHTLDISACRVNYVYKGSFSFMRYLLSLDIFFNTCLSSRRNNEEEEKCKRSDESCCNRFCEQFQIADDTVSRVTSKWKFLPIPRTLKTALYKNCFLRYEIPQYTVTEIKVNYIDVALTIYVLHGKNKYQVQNKGKPDDANQYEYDAFISYENKDRVFVHEKLLHCLEHEAGLKLCIHKRDFLPGNDIAANITSAIHNSRKVVIVMSHNYLDSYWCMFEYNMAKVESIYSRNKENILFLVFLEQMAPNVLPMMVLELVQSSSYIEYPNDEFGDTVFWDRLREVLSQ
ncbi:Toll-like receptor 4 [Mytilus edulis]|uniref:Toll-like receptor 4 n=1 Tax=Mytilus edulis TaxID=6550 RepID=A0A8S3UEX2_MYTED|nr:Toll-like receptor 4 [Mytilus edulis]